MEQDAENEIGSEDDFLDGEYYYEEVEDEEEETDDEVSHVGDSKAHLSSLVLVWYAR